MAAQAERERLRRLLHDRREQPCKGYVPDLRGDLAVITRGFEQWVKDAQACFPRFRQMRVGITFGDDCTDVRWVDGVILEIVARHNKAWNCWEFTWESTADGYRRSGCNQLPRGMTFALEADTVQEIVFEHCKELAERLHLDMDKFQLAFNYAEDHTKAPGDASGPK
jgi:hypothetical protein